MTPEKRLALWVAIMKTAESEGDLIAYNKAKHYVLLITNSL